MTVAIATTTLIVCVTAWLAIVRFRRGPTLSPFSITLFLLASIFAVRPLMLAEEGDWWLYGVNVQSGTTLAAAVGLWATVALIFGYLIGSAKKKTDRSLNSTSTVDDAPSLTRATVVCVSASISWFVAMAIIGGGFRFVQELAAGRSAEIAQRLAGVPVIISAVPVAGVIVLCVARASIESNRRIRPMENFWFYGAAALACFPPLALGNRRLLIPVALSVLITLVRPAWNRRVGLLTSLTVAAGALVVAALPFVRSAGSRTASGNLVDALVVFFQDNGVTETVRSFFVSYDTEMFSYIALVGPQLGTTIPYGNGRGTIGELLMQPIPAALSPWQTWSNSLLTQIYGGGCGVAACPVPSIVGILLFDLGLIGVVIGMVLVGIGFRYVERAMISRQGFALIVPLAVVGFVPGIVRGNSISQLWIVANVVAVAVVLQLLAKRKTSRASTAAVRRGAPAGDVALHGSSRSRV